MDKTKRRLWDIFLENRKKFGKSRSFFGVSNKHKIDKVLDNIIDGLLRYDFVYKYIHWQRFSKSWLLRQLLENLFIDCISQHQSLFKLIMFRF